MVQPVRTLKNVFDEWCAVLHCHRAIATSTYTPAFVTLAECEEAETRLFCALRNRIYIGLIKLYPDMVEKMDGRFIIVHDDKIDLHLSEQDNPYCHSWW